jgi:glycerol-3-phosphate acyltransferase PlsY
MFTPFLIAALLGYFLGAIPFGFLVARARGVNIFEVGSKSPGATNVKRMIGRGPGNLVFALDALKGAVAGAGRWRLSRSTAMAMARSDGWPIGCALTKWRSPASPVHSSGTASPAFTRFKGGKGVATGAGGFLVLPMALIVQKYGGTSVGDVERIKKVAERIKATRDEGNSWSWSCRPVPA